MIQITSVDHIDGTDIVVDFSNGTSARFSVEQLLALTPVRAAHDSPVETNGSEGE